MDPARIAPHTRIYSVASALVAKGLATLAAILYREERDALRVELLAIKETHDPNISLTPLPALLVLGEDHRFHHHSGIDLISIFRAFAATIKGNIQGGSTIEQQLVRTIRSDYARTIHRKFRELLLAADVQNTLTKSEVLIAYLQVAYFGTGRRGLHQVLVSEQISPLISITVAQAATIIAMMKYPSQVKTTYRRRRQIAIRSNYLAKLHCGDIRLKSVYVPERIRSMEQDQTVGQTPYEPTMWNHLASVGE